MRCISVVGMILMCIIIFNSSLRAQEQEKKSTQEENKSSSQELLDRIDTLEKELKKIQDESKARKSLEVTEEEKTEKGKEVLEAISREYTLSAKGTLSIDYSVGYSYSPSEVIYTSQQVLDLQRSQNHNITNSIYTSYSILDNLTTSLSLPIVYVYNKLGTSESLSQSDIGDISLGVGFQLPSIFKLPGDIRNTYSFGAAFPTGRSPYKINPKTELSTGSGQYSVSFGSSFSKQMDPVVVFWSLGMGYPFGQTNLNYRVQNQVTLDKVEPGLSFNFSMGMGYALSYANSFNMSFGYGYQKASTLTYKELTAPIKTGDVISASIGIGMGFMVTPKTTMSVSLGIPLTGTGFSLGARVPFNFVL